MNRCAYCDEAYDPATSTATPSKRPLYCSVACEVDDLDDDELDGEDYE